MRFMEFYANFVLSLWWIWRAYRKWEVCQICLGIDHHVTLCTSQCMCLTLRSTGAAVGMPSEVQPLAFCFIFCSILWDSMLHIMVITENIPVLLYQQEVKVKMNMESLACASLALRVLLLLQCDNLKLWILKCNSWVSDGDGKAKWVLQASMQEGSNNQDSC
jgi:hypothetical protein